MTAGKFIISASPSACRRRSTDSRSPIESARRGDSNLLAGTHDDAINQTSSGSSSQTSSSQWMPSVPRTLAISCGSATTAVVPCAQHHPRELVDHQLGRLDVHVRIDEARHEVAPAGIDTLTAGVAAEARDTPVCDRDVEVEPLLRERREDHRVLDHEVGLDITPCDVDQAAPAHSLEHVSARPAG